MNEKTALKYHPSVLIYGSWQLMNGITATICCWWVPYI